MEEENKDIKEPEVINTEPSKDNDKKGLCITSLVLGIIAVVFICIWYISIPCGVLAIIFGILGRKSKEKGMAIAGIATGAIGVAISIALLIIIICSIATGLTKTLENLGHDDFANSIYDSDYDTDIDDDIDVDYDYDSDSDFE